MATYIYRDPATGDTKEVVHGMNESPVIVNEATGNRIKRVITGNAGFMFKKNGFYITENRSSNYKAAEKAESASASPAPSCATGCCGGACAN